LQEDNLAIHLQTSFLRFLASGAFNTLITYGVYLALLQVWPYWLSYTFAFASGIALAYVLNRYFVFRASGGRYGPVLVLVIYIGQFLMGLGLVAVWVHWLNGPVALAPIFSIALSLPLTFILNRKVFRHRKHASALLPSK
jgi:putative flippase GtrA